MKTALLLIAHGSKRAEANEDLEYLADQLRRRGLYPVVQCSYLELAQPDTDAGGALCVAQGADRVLMLPYFLSAGMHVTADLEEARSKLAQKHPNAEFKLCEPIGRHPLMLEIVTERARQAEKP